MHRFLPQVSFLCTCFRFSLLAGLGRDPRGIIREGAPDVVDVMLWITTLTHEKGCRSRCARRLDRRESQGGGVLDIHAWP